MDYMKKTAPTPKRKPDWKAHFAWLRSKSHKNDAKVLKEFEYSRRRLAARERAMDIKPRGKGAAKKGHRDRMTGSPG